MRSAWSAVLAGLALSGGGGGGVAAAELAEATRAVHEMALAADGAYRLVASLTTEVGHRFAGSPGDARAVAWATEKLRELGFPRVWTEPVTVPRWIRGEASGEIVAPWPQRVALIALGGSVATPDEGLEAAIVPAADLDELERLSATAVRGKIVYLSGRMRRTSGLEGYGDAVTKRGRGPDAASAKGALAVLIRSVGTDSNRLPHTGATRYRDAVPRIPAAALSNPDADLLERQLASGREVRFRLRLASRSEGEAQSANVLGEFPGTTSPQEIVLLVAHLDSWDVGTGAQDDAAGVAIAAEAARLAVAATGGAPRRTVRVLLSANEEFGLSGARAYAAAHAAEVEAHVVGIEADLGAGRVHEFRTRFAPEDAAAVEELRPRLAPLGIEVAVAEAFGGADLIPLRRLRVPLVDLQNDASRYFDIHHTENDTLDKIDAESLRQVVAAFATVAEWAANRPHRLALAPVEAEEER